LPDRSSPRKQAQAEGLDPNVWFGNVELMVAKEHRPGDRALRNIYKYYVANKRTIGPQRICEQAKQTVRVNWQLQKLEELP
jgi:hypothetical protein